MIDRSWIVLVWLMMAFGYLMGALFGYMASLFSVSFGWVLIPIWIGISYLLMKDRKNLIPMFKWLLGTKKEG